MAKLTAVDVAAIRQSPLSNRKAGAVYGVDRSLISRIRSGKVWRVVGTALLVAFALVTPAWGDDVRVLTPGAPAPYPGLLLDEGAAAKVTVDLKKSRTLEAEVETMKAQLAAAQQEAQALRDANREMRGALDAADKALARVEKTMDAYDRALTKSNDLMDRQAKRIDQLENREMWMMILGPIGLGLGYLLH